MITRKIIPQRVIVTWTFYPFFIFFFLLLFCCWSQINSAINVSFHDFGEIMTRVVDTYLSAPVKYKAIKTIQFHRKSNWQVYFRIDSVTQFGQSHIYHRQVHKVSTGTSVRVCTFNCQFRELSTLAGWWWRVRNSPNKMNRIESPSLVSSSVSSSPALDHHKRFN